jgi:hypothetical protein
MQGDDAIDAANACAMIAAAADGRIVEAAPVEELAAGRPCETRMAMIAAVPREAGVATEDRGEGFIFRGRVVIAIAAAEPHCAGEWLHHEVAVERLARPLDPFGLLEDDVGVGPRHLAARRRKVRRGDVQQPLLLPQHARAPELHHTRTGLQLERRFAERHFDDEDVGADLLHARHERIEIPALGRVARGIEVGGDDPEIGAHDRIDS